MLSAIKEIQNQFRQRLAEAGQTYVPRPKSLDLLARLERAYKQQTDNFWTIVQERSGQFLDYVEPLTALDMALLSLWRESQLETNGAIYGTATYNFTLNPIRLKLAQIETTLRTAESGLKIVGQGQVTSARVDIILTSTGPRIIELNTCWIDGIQALLGFQVAYLGQPQKPNPVSALAETLSFKQPGSLALLDITRGSGSRASAAAKEIEILANQLTLTNRFSTVEILNPRICRPAYIRTFPSLYINGDPNMLSSSDQDWVELLSTKRVFPVWRPEYDDKQLLVAVSVAYPQLFAQTSVYTNQTGGYIKGKGFSNRVFESQVWQPELTSIPIGDQWVFDTSSRKAKLLPNPRFKLTVWVISGRAVGVLASISTNPYISDRDFNCVPIPL